MGDGVADLVGVQVPRVVHRPRGSRKDASDCADLASAYGLVPDPWQRFVLDSWLVRDRAGRWAAGRWGVAVPRQNGKNGILEMVELYFMAVLGLKILHTAHEVKTARKAFLRIASFFENARQYPELAELVREIRRTNGQEAITLTNGGSVEFIARSKGSGRGFTVDALVCDEAQEYGEDAQAALLPTISAAPSGDPLQILLGTPPAAGMDGDVFTRMRDAGVAGKDKRLAWCEWSVQGESDVEDRTTWAETNPSLGGRLNWATVEDEFWAMSVDTFDRERRGRWLSDETQRVIPESAWSSLVAAAPDGVEVAAYGVDMNPERTWASVAVALRDGNRIHVEVADLGDVSGAADGLVSWLVKRAGRRVPVVMDAFSPARSIEPMLKARGVRMYALSGAELMQACGGIYDAAVTDKSLTHFDQAPLNDSLAGATKKAIGDAGGWKWNRKSIDVDLTPVMSVTCAHFGATKFYRAPRGGGKVLVLS